MVRSDTDLEKALHSRDTHVCIGYTRMDGSSQVLTYKTKKPSELFPLENSLKTVLIVFVSFIKSGR